VLLAHGGGGSLTSDLIERVFMPAFQNEQLADRHDGAVLALDRARLAFSTDAYVVQPLFFPGGDIGSLAVNGTVNDLAMCGARPLQLSAAFVIEEGLAIATLERIARSMGDAARAVGACIVTGDTKVVDRGKGDGLFVATSGIGRVETPRPVGPSWVEPGDFILLSGDIGRHGIAIVAAREGLAFGGRIESDCAPLWGSVARLIGAGIEIHCLRDLTRGGLASALVEIAHAAHVRVEIAEAAISVSDPVQGACEILGFDPLQVANEGRFVAFVPARQADAALAILRAEPAGAGANIIGAVSGRAESASPRSVTMRTRLGTSRLVERLSGEQLPRIC
jgi:hydrogenase expression/formation protein HypE